MTTRTASLRLQLIDAFTKPGQGVVKTMSAIDRTLQTFGKGKSPEIQKLVRQLESLKSKSGAIKAFTDGRRGLKELSQEFKLASSNAARLEAAFKATTKPTAQMKRDLDNARSSLQQTRKAFMEQGQAVRAAEKALQAYGIGGREAIGSSQKAIRNQIAQTIREMRRLDREARKPVPKPPRPERPPGRVPSERSPGYDAASMMIGGAAANTGRNIVQRAFTEAVDMDRATAYQRALGQPDINESGIGRLNAQAEQIGRATRFTNADVVSAQTLIMQAGIRNTDAILNLMGPITDYALAMGTTLDEAAETVRGSALSKQVNLRDAQAVTTFVDFLVKMAKNSGMTNDDVAQYQKYSGAATTTAGLPDTYSAAIGMVLRQAGLRGDEAGVFARTAAAKLVAPTNKGRTALSSMGIDYDKYVTMPDAMSVKGLETTISTKFGKRFTDDIREQISDLFENGVFTDENGNEMPIASDPGQFNAAVSEILGPLVGKGGGADRKAVSKAIDDFWKYSAQSVDVTGLLNAIMQSKPNPGALNAFFTERQGARAQILAQKWDQFEQLLDLMSHIEPGTANKIGAIANEGLYGDVTRLTGSVENAYLTIGRDWEFAIRPAIRATDEVVDGFANLSVSTRRLIEAVGAGVAIAGGFVAMKSMYGLFERVTGGKSGPGGGAATKPAVFAWLGRLASMAAPMVGFESLAGSTTPQEDATLASTDAATKALREKYGDATLQAARDKFQPLWRKTFSLDSADSRDESYIKQYLAEKAMSAIGAGPPAMQKGDSLAPIPPSSSPVLRVNGAFSLFEKLDDTYSPRIDTSSIDAAIQKADQLRQALSGVGGSVGTPTNTNSFGGPRAAGGPVQAGKTYLVGEEGPEPFIPSRNGTILPNSALGGGVTVNATFNLHGKATEEDAMTVLRQLNNLVRRSSQTMYGGLK